MFEFYFQCKLSKSLAFPVKSTISLYYQKNFLLKHGELIKVLICFFYICQSFLSLYNWPNTCISTELWIYRYWFDRIIFVNVLIF